MNAEEKARELIDKYRIVSKRPKLCALICVEELIDNADELSYMEYDSKSYWQEVKSILEKL